MKRFFKPLSVVLVVVALVLAGFATPNQALKPLMPILSMAAGLTACRPRVI